MPPRRPTAPRSSAARARPGTPRTAPAKSLAKAPAKPLSRPAARPPAAAPRGGRRPAVIRPATLIAGTFVILVVLLAPSVRPWLAQRSQLAASRAEVARLHADVAGLAEERRRWQDPEYVKTQARARLNFVLPGETSYVVIDDRAAAASAADPVRRAAQVATPRSPWYGDLWTSVVVAGGARAAR